MKYNFRLRCYKCPLNYFPGSEETIHHSNHKRKFFHRPFSNQTSILFLLFLPSKMCLFYSLPDHKVSPTNCFHGKQSRYSNKQSSSQTKVPFFLHQQCGNDRTCK